MKILSLADGHPLSEDVIQEHVNARLRPVPPQALFDEALTLLRSEAYIKARPPELGDDEPRWLMTERGETWLDSKPG